METQSKNYRPAGRLVPVFAAHEGLNTASLILALSKAATARGETVLVLDADDGQIMRRAGIVVDTTLGDVLTRGADIQDAKYIPQNEHFTTISAGDATLDVLLGSLAALSLRYDWVWVATEAGCTPAHVRLANAADSALLSYASQGDKFMRAYWMLDAIRARAPRFDPLMVVHGETAESLETYELLAGTVNDFLGAAPAFGGVLDTAECTQETATALLTALHRSATLDRKTA